MQPPRDCCEVEGDLVILGYRSGLPVVYQMIDVGNRVKLKILEADDPWWAESVEYVEDPE